MPKTVWVGDDHANLHQRTIEELVEIYPEYNRNAIRAIRNHHIKKGCTVERQQPYEGTEKERQRRKALGNMVLTTLEVPIEHLVYHQRLQEGLNEHGGTSKARFTDWEMGYTTGEGPERRANKIPLNSTTFEVTFENEPKWPPVTRVESVKLPKRESLKPPEASRSAVILPDLQIPFQSPEAVSVALQIVRDVKPDKVILLGDTLDLSAWSKYLQYPEFATATQDAIIQLHQLLATLRKMCPRAEIVVMAGNHEQRMAKTLLTNAQAAYGLKRADEPEGWPVMSVPNLCAFDMLDVEYIDGYPANRYWINERLQVRHGNVARPGGKTAVAIANDEKVSTIFGHIHRIESQFKTVNVYEGGRTSAAYGIGALCRIDGHVPSTKSGMNQRTNQPVENYENWQSGFAVVGYQDGDSPFNVEQVYINTFQNHETMYRGKKYQP